MGDIRLAQAIDSIQAQSYEDIEIVVVDGSDGGISDALRDQVDVYEFQEPRGLSAARNRGIELATGEYVAFLDEDDLFTPESVAVRVRELERGVDIVYGDWLEVGPEFELGQDDGTANYRTAPPVVDPDSQFVHQFVQQGLRPSAVMARADCFDAHTFDTERRIAEDFHLWIRLMHDFTVGKVDEAVLCYRVTPGSLSRSDRDAYRSEKLAAIDDLVERYPELEAYADLVRAREWYLHAREKVAAGDERAARSAALRSIRLDASVRSLLLFAVAFVPFGFADRVFSALERLR